MLSLGNKQTTSSKLALTFCAPSLPPAHTPHTYHPLFLGTAQRQKRTDKQTAIGGVSGVTDREQTGRQTDRTGTAPSLCQFSLSPIKTCLLCHHHHHCPCLPAFTPACPSLPLPTWHGVKNSPPYILYHHLLPMLLLRHDKQHGSAFCLYLY